MYIDNNLFSALINLMSYKNLLHNNLYNEMILLFHSKLLLMKMINVIGLIQKYNNNFMFNNNIWLIEV